MKILNKSRKIIGINGEPLLPGCNMDLPDGFEDHPAILDYITRGIICDADKDAVADLERARIAEEAIAKYKAEQEKRAAMEAQIRAVKDMKKPELLKKAAGMGLEAKDDDTVDVLKEMIIAAIEK